MYSAEILAKSGALLAACRERGLTLAAAESCTGGLLAGLLTEAAGSSDVFERGFVTYSNAAKIEMLGVPEEVLETFGAVSAETAMAMARGAIIRSRATLAVSITGVAGPGGGTPTKPVGLVCFAALRRGGTPLTVEKRFGAIGRAAVRGASLDQAIGLLMDQVLAG